MRQFWARTGPLLRARLKRPGIPKAVQVLDSVWEVALLPLLPLLRYHLAQLASQFLVLRLRFVQLPAKALHLLSQQRDLPFLVRNSPCACSACSCAAAARALT